MAFGGPAIFSNDPNIGIRQMGLDAFIPTPVSSITYKSRAGVDARRRQNYQNAPTRRRQGPPHEVVTLPDGNQVSVLLGGKKGKKPSSALQEIFPGASVPKPGQFGYGGPAPVARPNVRVPSAAQIADGITKLQDTIRKDKATRWPWEKQDQRNAADVINDTSMERYFKYKPVPGVLYA